MCLIIHKPAGVPVPFALLESAWRENPDGAGVMYHTGEATEVYKVTPGAWADPVTHLARVLDKLEANEVGVHFRWRTHGPIDDDNTHPFPIPKTGGWVMHNGVLRVGPGYADVSARMSDTNFYVRDALRDAPGVDNEFFWRLVGSDIGMQNKLLVMDAAGKFARVNDNGWPQYHGLRLSNTHSIPEMANYRAPYVYTPAAYGRADPRSGSAASEYLLEYDRERGYNWPPARHVPPLPRAKSRPVEPVTPSSAPAKLTRKERRILNECLRVGTWEPFARLRP